MAIKKHLKRKQIEQLVKELIELCEKYNLEDASFYAIHNGIRITWIYKHGYSLTHKVVQTKARLKNENSCR